MLELRWFAQVLVLVLSVSAAYGYAPETLHARCSVGPSDRAGQFAVKVWERGCKDDEHCGMDFSHDPFGKLTGITRADLEREGAQLTATLAAEPGTFVCAGSVQEGILKGESTFTPSGEFVGRMEAMGFTGLTAEKLEAYAFTGVESGWVKSLQTTGVKGMTTDNLIALRIFHVEPEYIRSITALGYAMPDAGKLIGMRVQKVDAEEVRKIRALGLQPSLDELVQMRIFGVTPEFIRNMQARGFKDLTVGKLVQIKIFKLDE